MRRSLKNMWNNMLHPTPLSLVLFYVVFILSITASIVFMISDTPFHWYYSFIFIIAIFSIIYCIYISVKYYISLKNKVKAKLVEKNILTFLTNYNVRSIIQSTFSFTINAVYAVFIGTLAIMSHSVWYGALTVFYLVISITRASAILKYSDLNNKKHLSHVETQKSKLITYKRCGISMTFLTLALGIFVAEMITNPHSFNNAEILIYPVAIYTIYKLTLAIINIYKAKKHDDIIVQATRNLNLAAVMVSLLTLQTNMLHIFAPNYNANTINIITGSICCGCLIILGLYMIISANRRLNNFYHITKK